MGRLGLLKKSVCTPKPPCLPAGRQVGLSKSLDFNKSPLRLRVAASAEQGWGI
jgi:hypothetical protein